MDGTDNQHQGIQRIARRVIPERGLLPDFSVEALTELVRSRHGPIRSDCLLYHKCRGGYTMQVERR